MLQLPVGSCVGVDREQTICSLVGEGGVGAEEEDLSVWMCVQGGRWGVLYTNFTLL